MNMKLEITQKIKKIKKTSFLTRINREQGSPAYLLYNKAIDNNTSAIYVTLNWFDITKFDHHMSKKWKQISGSFLRR